MIDTLVRMSGIDLAILGLLSLTITLTGLRRCEFWAWRAMWRRPLWLIAQLAVRALETWCRAPVSRCPSWPGRFSWSSPSPRCC